MHSSAPKPEERERERAKDHCEILDKELQVEHHLLDDDDEHAKPWVQACDERKQLKLVCELVDRDDHLIRLEDVASGVTNVVVASQ